MAGVLYIVATPIGNLGDIGARAAEVLRAADLIAAEDTRHCRKLLNHLGVGARLLSYHEHNETARGREILRRLEAGDSVALISDAGTPLISDPGYRLVRDARAEGIRVSPVPGPSSVVAALSAAGLPTDRFHFFGFLPAKSDERGRRLRQMQDLPGTLVLFESSHRIVSLLAQLGEIFPDRPLVLAKELTKRHERFLGGRARELVAQIEAEPELGKGEFVVLIDNAAGAANEGLSAADIDVIKLLLAEVSVKTAVKIAARVTGKKKNEIYRAALEMSAETAGDRGDKSR